MIFLDTSGIYALADKDDQNHDSALRMFESMLRSGEEILVTDRGAVVAELGPPGRASVNGAAPAGLAELATRGLLTLGAPNDAATYPKLPRLLTPGRVTRLLDEERGRR